ncbi:MAG: GAK system ATP-grasp enzyme [Desulfarculaceae bacterium]
MKTDLKIGVVGVPGGWSSERLADALEKATGFRLLVDLGEVSCDLEASQAFFKGINLTTLDGLAIKKVGPAYSPQLLDRLELLRFIEAQGVRIFSRPDRIIAVLNRLSWTVSLAKAGLPLPPTVVTEDVSAAAKAIEDFGSSVLKPLYTSKARGMVLIDPVNGLREDLANFKASGNTIIYAQKRLDLPGRDLGLVFLGGEYLATYARVANQNSWNTTRRDGGMYASYEPPVEVIEIARKAQAVFGLDFTSVDIAETDQGPVVFEVSAFGGFRGLLEGCNIDAAAAYAGHMVKELRG